MGVGVCVCAAAHTQHQSHAKCDICIYIHVYNQEVWFEIALARTETVKDTKGGVSAVVKKLLDIFFHGDHDPRTAGISLQLHDGGNMHLWLGLGPIIADESALHGIYSCKGAAGLKPCMLCCNLFNLRFRRAGIEAVDVDKWVVFHDHHDASDLVLQTRETLQTIIGRLSAPMSKTDRATLETHLGWNHNPDGLMADPVFRELASPIDHCLFDWMHVFLVSGVWNTAAFMMLTAFQSFGILIPMIAAYTEAWYLPGLRAKHGDCTTVFSAERWKSSKAANHIKCTASEALSCLQIMAVFCASLLAGGRPDAEKAHAKCYLQLVHLVELLIRSAKEVISAIAFTTAAADFLKTFRGLYGSDSMTPKFHSLLHFGRFLERWGRVPNCFVLERKHKMVKRCPC